MRTVCHSCDAQYEIPDDRAVGGDLLVRCPNCRAIMAVNARNVLPPKADSGTLSLLANEPSDDGASISAASAARLDEPTRPDLPTARIRSRSPAPQVSQVQASGWFANIEGARCGPYSDDEIKDLAAIGEIGPSSFVWKKGLPRWRQVQDTAELKDLGRVARRRASRERMVTEAALRVTHRRIEPDAAASDSLTPIIAPPMPRRRSGVFHAPEPLTVVKRPGRRVCVEAFVAGFLFVGFGMVVALYTVPALFF
jgi:predicted Zn finger-like uncharacterized protein